MLLPCKFKVIQWPPLVALVSLLVELGPPLAPDPGLPKEAPRRCWGTCLRPGEAPEVLYIKFTRKQQASLPTLVLQGNCRILYGLARDAVGFSRDSSRFFDSFGFCRVLWDSPGF